jgi:hypothetical protein
MLAFPRRDPVDSLCSPCAGLSTFVGSWTRRQSPSNYSWEGYRLSYNPFRYTLLWLAFVFIYCPSALIWLTFPLDILPFYGTSIESHVPARINITGSPIAGSTAQGLAGGENAMCPMPDRVFSIRLPWRGLILWVCCWFSAP